MSSISNLRKRRVQDGGRLPADWQTGEDGIPSLRYIDKDFAKLEAEQLWPRVWQMACRLDQIASPGDYVVYEILDQSVVVVRVDEDTVKAYHNVCPHRATALAVGTGRFQLDQIVCPFHGWKWNLKGENTFVLDQHEFRGGCMSNHDVDLKQVHTAIWAGFVYVNLSKDPPPFDQVVAPIDALVDGVKLGDMKFHYHYQAKVNCNWKIALEAFIESYHVPQTHPQLTPRSAEEFTSIYIYEPKRTATACSIRAARTPSGASPFSTSRQ